MKPVQAPRFEDWLREQKRDPEFRGSYESGRRAVHLAYQMQGLRRSKGWTQAELARRMGTSQQAISRLEQGDHHGVTLRTLERMAHALKGELVVEIRTAARRRKPADAEGLRKRRHAG